MKERRNLQDATDFKVMNIKECLDALGWNYTEDGDNYNDISCPCGGELKGSGFVGTEVVECQKCGKKMVDLFSPIKVSNATATILDPSNFKVIHSRHWIADDNNGGIKVK